MATTGKESNELFGKSAHGALCSFDFQTVEKLFFIKSFSSLEFFFLRNVDIPSTNGNQTKFKTRNGGIVPFHNDGAVVDESSQNRKTSQKSKSIEQSKKIASPNPEFL